MDYIPGGDLMSLLIKKDIFDEPLARFYIAGKIIEPTIIWFGLMNEF